MLESLETEAGYDDERIVYRTTPYRLDYYQYHRWSAPPGVDGRQLPRAGAREDRDVSRGRARGDRAARS